MNILRNRWKRIRWRLLLSVLVLLGSGAVFSQTVWAELGLQVGLNAQTDTGIQTESQNASGQNEEAEWSALEENEEPGKESARGSWQQEEGAWYFILPDGTKNREDVIWQNALYEFYYDGSLKSAQWIPNTGGGAYPVFCYDAETQELFDQLNEEKRDIFFEEHPERVDSWDGDEKIQYDRYAGFLMDARLNEAASHRLELALENGYSGDSIPGEGTLKEYLETVPYRKNAAAQELYIRGREDAEDAFSRIMAKTQMRYDSTEKRRYSLGYYRRIGMAHAEKDGEQYFMVILMR